MLSPQAYSSNNKKKLFELKEQNYTSIKSQAQTNNDSAITVPAKVCSTDQLED